MIHFQMHLSFAKQEVVSRSFISAKIDSDLQSVLQKVTGKLEEGNRCLTNDVKVNTSVYIRDFM